MTLNTETSLNVNGVIMIQHPAMRKDIQYESIKDH